MGLEDRRIATVSLALQFTGFCDLRPQSRHRIRGAAFAACFNDLGLLPSALVDAERMMTEKTLEKNKHVHVSHQHDIS